MLDEMELTLKSTLEAAEQVCTRTHAHGDDGGSDAELKLQHVHGKLRASLARLPTNIRRAILEDRHPTLFRLHPPQLERPEPEPELKPQRRRASPVSNGTQVVADTHPENTVETWLATIGLDQYTQAIKEAGYKSMRFLQAASADDVDDLVSDVGMEWTHGETLTAAWRELIDESGGFKSQQTTECSPQNCSTIMFNGDGDSDAHAEDASASASASVSTEAEPEPKSYLTLRPVHSPLRVRRGSPMLHGRASPGDKRVRVVPGIATASYTRDADQNSARSRRSISGARLSAPARQPVSPRRSTSTRVAPVSARQIAYEVDYLNDVHTVDNPRAPWTVRQSPIGVTSWADPDPILDVELERPTRERKKLDQRLRATRRLSPAKVREVAERQQDWEQRRLEKLTQKRELAKAQEQKQCTFSPNRRRPAQRTVAECREAAERLSTTAANRDAHRKQESESRAQHELAEQKKHRFHSPRNPARTEQLAKLAKPTRPPPRSAPRGAPRGRSPDSPGTPGSKTGSPGRLRSPARIEALSRPRSPRPTSRPNSPNSKTGQRSGSPRRVNKAAAASGARLYGQAVDAQKRRQAQAQMRAHGSPKKERPRPARLSPSPSSTPTRKPQVLTPVEDDA
eukprot:COSAG02_NODE_1157_length_14186_cov_11.986299_3_plen_627_part_00